MARQHETFGPSLAQHFSAFLAFTPLTSDDLKARLPEEYQTFLSELPQGFTQGDFYTFFVARGFDRKKVLTDLTRARVTRNQQIMVEYRASKGNHN